MKQATREAWLRGVIVSIINAGMSGLAAWLVFGRQASIPVVGMGGIALDALPQSAVITFMTCLMTGLALRRSGQIPSVGWGDLTVQSLAAAFVVAVLTGAVGWMMLTALTPTHWTSSAVIAYKMVYGAVLGLILMRPALWFAMQDVRPLSRCRSILLRNDTRPPT
ncbi:hypothetical protein [Novosphingobium sp.]|uniref:hypothetical protein n=1 Tax=Novosphingobium sp. TaxID=1874826 RepID=UPI002FE41DAA